MGECSEDHPEFMGDGTCITSQTSKDKLQVIHW